MIRTLIPTVVLIAALTACSSGTPPHPAAAASSPTSASPVASPPAPSPTGSAPLTFASAMDLVAALNAHGLPCGKPTPVANPTNAVTLVDCGPNVVVATFASHAQVLQEFDRLRLASADVHVHLAVGWNWTVNADAAYAQKVATVFGVQYQTTA